MRFVSQEILDTAVSTTSNSSAIDINQLFAGSLMGVGNASNVSGTMVIQVSNDVCTNGQRSTFTPTNWTTLTSPAITITGTSTFGIDMRSLNYSWLRAQFVNAAVGVQTITTVADSAGSLNSTYFLISSQTTNYYVWLDNGTGVDPAIVGRTGVQVIYANNDSANTIAELIKVQLDALATIAATRTNNVVTCTNSAAGSFTAPANGTASPGFTFAVTNNGTSDVTLTLFGQGA